MFNLFNLSRDSGWRPACAAGGCGGWEGGCGGAGAPAGTGRELLLPPQCAANDPKLSFGCVAAVSLLSHHRLSFVVECW